MPTNLTNLLLRNHFIAMPGPSGAVGEEALATVLMNLSYYGFALNVDAYRSLTQLGPVDLAVWWQDIETEMKTLTGDDLKIGDFVVYKNFPAEVLEKTEAQYWIPQILMYWGFSPEFFTEEVKPREKMSEQPRCKVLQKANKGTLDHILGSYLSASTRWKDQELQDVLFLTRDLPVNVAKLAFKENLVSLASNLMKEGRSINITTATDILRLAAGLSDGDVSLREKSKLISFKRPVRKFLLYTLEKCGNIAEDVARRPEMWKRLFHQLHGGDWKREYPLVCQVMDDLYHDRLTTFNSKVETMLLEKNLEVLGLLSTRPGDFRRRLVHTLDLFGGKAADAFVSEAVIGKLTTAQVVGLRSYLETVNGRSNRVFPPKGNWSRLQIGEARFVADEHVETISNALGRVLAKRIPKIKKLDDATALIKLPNNGGEVSPYARGTVFPIPDGVEFIRTASYWEKQADGVVWFDNGWNFFDARWKTRGAISWNQPNFEGGAAAFSGDPLSTNDAHGRAAQLIDLYPGELLKRGVRYAVWNILCYSSIPFGDAKVFSALQWGEDAEKGKLFEPSRAQLAFPLTGKSLTKYICLIDLEKREMVYLDANLKGSTSSAASNCATLEKQMPAFMQYLRSLPSVHDLFRESVDEKCDGPHILYSDKDTELQGVSAYVFKPENKMNKFKPVDINTLLAT